MIYFERTFVGVGPLLSVVVKITRLGGRTCSTYMSADL